MRATVRRFEMVIHSEPICSTFCRGNESDGQLSAVIALEKDEAGEVFIVVRPPELEGGNG